MNFKDLALKRESCRDYSDKPVSHELLEEIMATACLSPSACNSQPWKLIGAEGEVAVALRPLVQECGRNKFAVNVPAFVAICETEAKLMPGVNENNQHFAQMDVGMVTMMLTLAAADAGLDTCILGCFNEEKIKEVLEIPDDVVLRLVVAVGYGKTEEPRKKVRKNAEDVCSFNRW